MEQMERTTLTTPDLFDPELDKLVPSVGQQLVFPPKHIFSMPGEELGGIYYVQKGRIKHYMDNAEGGVKILYTLSPGWFFGETVFFLKTRTSLYSQTETKVIMYKLLDEDVKRMMDESALFRDALFRCWAHKTLILRHEIANLTFNSCKSRLKRLFCSMVDTDHITDPAWYSLKVHYTHGELGEIVGGARVTISRQLTELCNEGFLRIINRRAQVSAEAYQEYARSQGKE